MGGWGCTTGSGPDGAIGPRSVPDRAPIGPRLRQSGPDCAVGPKLASPSFAIDTVAIRMLRKNGVEL